MDRKHTYFGSHIRTLFCSLLLVILATMVLAVIYLGHFKHLYVMYKVAQKSKPSPNYQKIALNLIKACH